jgi:hypothetical protein
MELSENREPPKNHPTIILDRPKIYGYHGMAPLKLKEGTILKEF